MISVLVPFAPSSRDDRNRNFAWTSARWRAILPKAEIVVEGTPASEPGAFEHDEALNRAAARATGNVFLIADADQTVNPAWVGLALDLDLDRTWALSVAFRHLMVEQTERLVTLPPDVEIEPGSDAWETRTSFAPPLLLSRAAFEAVGGYDERSRGWSGDDVCLMFALSALWGEPTRIAAETYHLWHEAPLDDNYGQPDFPENRELMERYEAAAGDVDAMKALLSEPGGPLA